MHYEYYKDEDGVSRLYCHADYVYDVKTGYVLSSCSIYHNADGTRRPGHETAYEYDEKNRPISYVCKQYNNGEPDTEEHTYTHYGEGGEVIQLVKKEIDHSWKTEIVTTTDYENEKKVKQTKESRGNDRMSGWELRRFVSVETYDEEGQVVTWDYYVYQGDTLDTLDELIREEHTRNDYVEGNDWFKTEQTKTYEDGKLVSEVFKTYDEQWLIDYEKTNYQNGVKLSYTVGDYDSKLRIELNEEGYNTYYTGGRPIAYTTTFYDTDGNVTHVEHWEYQYHENCYTAYVNCKTYDKDGNLLSQTTKTFDEEGKLLTEETN